MDQIVTRTISKHIIAQKNKFPILALTGPRQSGKTTLLRTLFTDYRYVSLENPDVRAFAKDDPIGFLKQYDNKVIFDEVQRSPELFSYLQGLVDKSRQMGQFILSGSQNFHLLNNITQSLAGRVVLFRLLPFDFMEMKSERLLSKTYEENILNGFYPAIYNRSIDPKVFYANYIQTYIEKDVTELVSIQNIKSFRIFLKLCAGRAGQLLNISSIANECDISHTTARSWLSILESSYIIFLLQPYYKNYNKRLIKSPKLYFYDTGLLSNLLGLRVVEDVINDRLKGNLFENMIISEFQKRIDHLYLHKELNFWQDSNGNEVDLLLKEPAAFNIFEIKSTHTITPVLFKGMDNFETIVAPEKVNKTLIYGGDEDQTRSKYNVQRWSDITLT